MENREAQCVWQYLREMVICQENSGEMHLESGAEGIIAGGLDSRGQCQTAGF